MGTTTFSGPIKAGGIQTTTGTTAGTDVANVGSVVLAQSVNVQSQSAARKTGIVIPANSQIVRMQMCPSASFTDPTTFGTTSAGTGLTDSKANMNLNLVSDLDPATGATWNDVGSTDVEIWIKGTNATGTGVLTVSYIQNNNLTT